MRGVTLVTAGVTAGVTAKSPHGVGGIGPVTPVTPISDIGRYGHARTPGRARPHEQAPPSEIRVTGVTGGGCPATVRRFCGYPAGVTGPLELPLEVGR